MHAGSIPARASKLFGDEIIDTPLLALGSAFFDPVEAADFPACTPRFLNRRAASSVGLGRRDDDWWARHFCRFEPLADNLPQPLAMRYHGHQFRHYNPDIGDGRGFTFAQVRDGQSGRLLELGTKGSGRTPYSRHADGRLTLKGGVREVLASEMLEALGVETSRSFALFETGESLVRGDEPSPTRSAVLTRLSRGHIRIGTFQRLAYFGEREGIVRLVDYCLGGLFGEPIAGDSRDNALRLFALASAGTARLAASYLAAGFVHGVLNSDNINITGESFDYGPWRFTPYWDLDFVAAYFDEAGLYAFGRQPEAIHWNLAQLAGCLALTMDDTRDLSDMLSRWAGQFNEALAAALVNRLGVTPATPSDDLALSAAIVEALAARQVTIDRFFHDWRGGRVPGDDHYRDAAYAEVERLAVQRQALPDDPYWHEPVPCSLHIDEVETIWAAVTDDDDWSLFDGKIAAIRRMGDAVRSRPPA